MIGRVGRIDFPISRAARQVERQIACGRVNGRLHVARGAVDIAIQVELNGDARSAQRADRSDFR